jgi:glycosyltransferase involved in cell wall biosynthesis
MFLINILINPIFNKYKKCIIGENYDDFLKIPNSNCLGLVEQNKSIEYLSKSKLLLFPSLFDANSNTVREAVHTNCFPLITHNIGFSELFPDYLICDTYTESEWTNKILYILENYTKLKLDIKYKKIGNSLINILDIYT